MTRQEHRTRERDMRKAIGPDKRASAHRGADAPAHVIAERDRARGAPRDLTATVLGDPLPGRSALDRRRA